MTPLQKSWLLAVAIVVYAVWQAREILLAWRDAPFDRLGWLAFGIWAAPLLLCRWREKGACAEPSPGWLAAGLGASFLGAIVSMNALCYGGLALALAGLSPRGWDRLPWVLCAVAWMPALGYLLHALAAAQVAGVRLALAGAGSFWMIWRWRKAREARA